jgi:predicted NAD/FAD-binding protein
MAMAGAVIALRVVAEGATSPDTGTMVVVVALRMLALATVAAARALVLRMSQLRAVLHRAADLAPVRPVAALPEAALRRQRLVVAPRVAAPMHRQVVAVHTVAADLMLVVVHTVAADPMLVVVHTVAADPIVLAAEDTASKPLLMSCSRYHRRLSYGLAAHVILPQWLQPRRAKIC